MTDNTQHQPTGAPSPTSQEAPESLHPVLQFLHDNLKAIVAGIVLVLLVVGGVSGYRYYNEQQFENAHARLGEIVVNNSGLERIAALETFIEDGAGPAESKARLELAKTAMDAGVWDVAAGAWAEIADTEDPDMRAIGLLGQASARIESGEYARALEVMEKGLKNAPSHYKLHYYRLMAMAAERSENYTRAYSYYQQQLALDTQNQDFINHKMQILREKTDNIGS